MSDRTPSLLGAAAAVAATGERTCRTCGSIYPADFAVCPRDATPLVEDNADGDADPLIGSVLAGTYRLVHVLGEGGMARLYQAEHTRIDRRFAVKVIHEDLAGSADLVTRFEREARAAARIASEHVIGVVDILRTADGRPCIVAELLEGEDLQAHLDRVGRLSPNEAIPIARQICRALDAAHRRGVVHRDLKPANVFLCAAEGPTADAVLAKVVDFGVAKLADDGSELTRSGAVVGTPAYMAPEQARRASEAGPLADIYAVGSVLYRMLTGEPPYGKDPPANPLVLLLAEEPERPRALEPSIPVAVEAVVQHAMARDPTLRPASALELEEELAAVDLSTGPPVLARPDGAAAAPATSGSPAAATRAPAAAARPGATRPGNTATPIPQVARSATLARPAAIFLASACSLAAAMWAGALVAALSGADTTAAHTLVDLLAAATGIGTAFFLRTRFRPRWRSAVTVWQLDLQLARALGSGIAALGALELFARGTAAMSGPAIAASAGGLAVRLLLAGLAAAVAARPPRLVSRLTRRDDAA